MGQTRAPASERKIVGLRLRNLRKERGRTTMDLAVALEITPGAVEQIEQGKSSIRAENLWIIASQLDMDPVDLFRKLYLESDAFTAYRLERSAKWKALREAREEDAGSQNPGGEPAAEA